MDYSNCILGCRQGKQGHSLAGGRSLRLSAYRVAQSKAFLLTPLLVLPHCLEQLEQGRANKALPGFSPVASLDRGCRMFIILGINLRRRDFQSGRQVALIGSKGLSPARITASDILI